jgi:phosphoenolpyruvate synthase/pyruvate phosphate dikinase
MIGFVNLDNYIKKEDYAELLKRELHKRMELQEKLDELQRTTIKIPIPKDASRSEVRAFFEKKIEELDKNSPQVDDSFCEEAKKLLNYWNGKYEQD